MDDLAELFPDFTPHYVPTDAGKLFVRVGGRGEPLLLAHGFPETGAMWHRLAPYLTEHFTVVVPDLRGYGWSAAPDSQNGEGYAKWVMGADLVTLMEALGHARFAFAGHDRGARIGYRLALDHPGRITRLALLDIAPTFAVWEPSRRNAERRRIGPSSRNPRPVPRTRSSGTRWATMPA